MDKFSLQDASVTDQQAFKDGLKELLDKLSLNLVINIIKTPVGIKMEDGSVKNVFADEPTIILQKKVAIPDTSEPEAPKITDVKAEPTISPFVPQPNDTDSTPA
jgi:hypothetical protein